MKYHLFGVNTPDEETKDLIYDLFEDLKRQYKHISRSDLVLLKILAEHKRLLEGNHGGTKKT